MTSILFPGAHGSSYKFRIAQFAFTRCPYFISTALFVVWRTITGRHGLDQFFSLRSPGYGAMFKLLARIPVFAETAQFALDSAAVEGVVCDISEYGPDRSVPSGTSYDGKAVKAIVHHVEFHGQRAQERYTSAIPDEAIYEDSAKLQSIIDGLVSHDTRQRAVTGGWLFFTLRKLLLIFYHDGRGTDALQIGQRSADLQKVLRVDAPRPSRKLSAI